MSGKIALIVIVVIDNVAAQASLVKGSSSVDEGDVITGYTWELACDLGVRPWFDRVASKSNPVDGISRGDLKGDWDEIRKCGRNIPPKAIY